MTGDKSWIASLHRERTVSRKNWALALFLSVFLGMLGFDRFYTGRHDLGVLKLFSVGGFFIWWVADVVLLLTGRMKDGLGKTIRGPGSGAIS
jgi:TM2 domain-containing membrane protein YozV